MQSIRCLCKVSCPNSPCFIYIYIYIYIYIETCKKNAQSLVERALCYVYNKFINNSTYYRSVDKIFRRYKSTFGQIAQCLCAFVHLISSMLRKITSFSYCQLQLSFNDINFISKNVFWLKSKIMICYNIMIFFIIKLYMC